MEPSRKTNIDLTTISNATYLIYYTQIVAPPLRLLGLLAVSMACIQAADLHFIEAVKIGDLKAVRSTIAQHVDVNATEADGFTALHWAAQRDNLPIADLLLKAGANVKAASRYNITPLSLACTNGDAALIDRFLTAGADPNSTSEQGQSALMTAALTGKVDAVKLLLARGARVNDKEPWKGQTALMWAVSEGNADAAAMLIEFGAEMNAKSTSGFTPFLFAVRNGHIDAAKVLLAHGANVNDVAPDGTSALGMAVINAYYELAVVLLEHGANPNAPDPRGSALHSLAWMRRPGSSPSAGAGGPPIGPPIQEGKVDSLELAKALLAHGANPNVRISWKEIKYNRDFGQVKLPPDIPIGRKYISYVGATPFYIAAQSGDAAYMRVLAAGGADPKLPTVQNITPLMAAAGIGYWDGESPGPYAGCPESERLDAVKVALELGNDINAYADFGDYPMEGDGQYLLLNYPLNINNMPPNALGDVRWSGATALHGAVVSGQISIVKYLIDHGAQVDAKTRLGWTPLMLANGVFVSNTKKEFPEIAVLLKHEMAKRNLLPAEAASTR
jgi:ankyrin repeat protein